MRPLAPARSSVSVGGPSTFGSPVAGEARVPPVDERRLRAIGPHRDRGDLSGRARFAAPPQPGGAEARVRRRDQRHVVGDEAWVVASVGVGRSSRKGCSSCTAGASGTRCPVWRRSPRRSSSATNPAAPGSRRWRRCGKTMRCTCRRGPARPLRPPSRVRRRWPAWRDHTSSTALGVESAGSVHRRWRRSWSDHDRRRTRCATLIGESRLA